MSKALFFYTIDEFQDELKYYKRKGLKPYKYKQRTLNGQPFDVVATQYKKDNYIYDVLEWDQCYSGYMLTLMRLPQLSYEELLEVALKSKYHDERAGAIGVILKDYPNQFQRYLLALSEIDINSLREHKRIKRMIIFINEFIKKNNSYVHHLDRILALCEKICCQINYNEYF